MPLLLFLSALLTALTGAVAGGRPVDVQIARQAQAPGVRQAAVAVVRDVAGHAHLLGAFGSVTTFAVTRAISGPAPVAPRLYLDRLRV